MRIIDSHAHYDDSAFDGDRDGLLKSLFSETSPIDKIINVGCSVKGSESSKALAEKYERMYFSSGLHPDAADEWKQLDVIRQLAELPKCVAIGEIGLDYHYENCSCDCKLQKRAFEEQLKLAEDLSMPVIIHSRDAWEDTMELLRKYRPKGVMHCFSGSAEIAREIIDMGMYIGFTGAVTFKNAKKARRALEVIPKDRLLCETDCPYMAPEPFRGRRSDSGMLPYTLGVLAECYGESPENMAEITAENAEKLFDI
ncbi:MAG: TatD family hydrolase [Oscillospiraceae bacterium]|nr:TatD family hydrolase [Oscillospiraceae bacterium]